MCSRWECASIFPDHRNSISLNLFSVCSRTSNAFSHTRATLTGWTSAGPTTINGRTKTSRTCKRHSLTLMWKARLSELEFDERELAEVLDAIDSEWITAGPRTQAFEKAFAQFTDT